MHFRLLAGVVPCALLLACSYQNPYVTRHQAQRKAAAELRPAELEQSGRRAAPVIRVNKRLTLRIYFDSAYQQRERNTRRHINDLVDHASEVLQNTLHARLEIESIRPLPEQVSDNNLDVVVKRLAELDPGTDVAFVLAFVGQHPIMTLSFHELGRAEWIGKHLAMRCLDDVEEQRALASAFDTLSTEARTHLYAERKQHKETAVLLHELGHSLGAVHASDPNDLLHPEYHNTATRFTPANLTLMHYILEDRLKSDRERDELALVKQVQAYFTQNDSSEWLAGERDTHLKLLAAAQERASAVQQQAAQQTAALSAPAEPTLDLSGLSEKDRAKFQAIEEHRKQQRVEQAYALVSELADRYKDNFAVQSKACELGMVFRVQPQFIMGYCARMSELQKAAKGK